MNTSEKYIAVETEQKNFILSKIEKIEKQLQDLKASLKKTVEGIQKEERRLTGLWKLSRKLDVPEILIH